MTENTEDKTLNLYPIDYPFETLVSRMNTNPPKLKLDPDFQRKYKWDKNGWERSSKFIESCLMRIPLPSCYFAEDDEGLHLVIDGVQRLTSVARFFNDEFELEGMTTFKELNGKKFSELGALKTELETTTIRCIILRKENPKRLIREIFSRLNQGAVELSDQEIRHALYPGSLDRLLSELGTTPVIARFGLAENSDVERNSLEPEEQILRFFAFTDDPELTDFNDNLKVFLDNYMEKNADIPEENINSYRAKFIKSLQNCIEVFGDNVFTKPAAERRRKGLVHYDLLMPTLGGLDADVARDKKENIERAYLSLCESDGFKRTLGGGLQNKSSISRRKESWSEFLEAAILTRI